jgi:hypothetical protein
MLERKRLEDLMTRFLIVAVVALMAGPALADCPQDVDAKKADIAVLQQQLSTQQASGARAADICRTETQLIEQMKSLGGIYEVCQGMLGMTSSNVRQFKSEVDAVDLPHKTRCGA